MRVFWPQDCLHGVDTHQPSVLVGWNHAGYVVVVTALPYLQWDVLSRLLERDVLLERGSAGQLYAPFANKRLVPLGIANGDQKKHDSFRFPNARHWLRAKSDGNQLKISLDGTPCSVITFLPPNPAQMQYLTLEPAKLYHFGKHTSELRPYLNFHCRNRESPPENGCALSEWNLILTQINCTFDLKRQLLAMSNEIFPQLVENPELVGQYAHQRRRSSFSGAAAALRKYGRRDLFLTIIRLRSLVNTLLTAMERPLRLGEYVSNSSILDVFCTARQLHLRLNQLGNLPQQYITIVGMNHQRWHYMTPQRNEAYIRFYNVLWLATYDIIWGVYFGQLIRTNEVALAELAFRSFNTLCDWLILTTQWLMLNPAGFKLNTQLAKFTGDVIIWSVSLWQTVVTNLFTEHSWRLVIRAIAWSGILGGAALQISLVLDTQYFLGILMWLLYQSLSKVYGHNLGALGALFRVFRGKKFNMLRSRVDSGNYDMNQLLMGTILFTVLLFLFPTVLAFYAMLLAIRLVVLAVSASLGVALALLNYFPLFPLLLRIRSPARLPSGLKFTSSKLKCRSQSYLQVRSRPMRVPEVFAQLTDAIYRFLHESFNWELLKNMALGEPVRLQPSAIYRGLYSVLPSQREGSSQLLAELKEYWD